MNNHRFFIVYLIFSLIENFFNQREENYKKLNKGQFELFGQIQHQNENAFYKVKIAQLSSHKYLQIFHGHDIRTLNSNNEVITLPFKLKLFGNFILLNLDSDFTKLYFQEKKWILML